MAVVINFSYITFLVLLNLLLVFFHGIVYADPPYCDCQGENFIEDSTFHKNREILLHSLSSNASISKFYETSIGNDMDTVYGLFLCYNYSKHDDCMKCAEGATKDIVNLCGKSKQAIVWREYCQLSYSNQKFFGHLDVAGNINQTNPHAFLDSERLRSTLNPILLNMSKLAASSTDKVGTAYVPFAGDKPIYALGQCTKDLSPDDCKTCLETAISNISSCCYVYRGARIFSRSCYLRYEFYDFINQDDNSVPTPEMPSESFICFKLCIKFPISANFVLYDWLAYALCTDLVLLFCHSSLEHSARKIMWMIVVLSVGATAVLVTLIGFYFYCLALRNQASNSNAPN